MNSPRQRAARSATVSRGWPLTLDIRAIRLYQNAKPPRIDIRSWQLMQRGKSGLTGRVSILGRIFRNIQKRPKQAKNEEDNMTKNLASTRQGDISLRAGYRQLPAIAVVLMLSMLAMPPARAADFDQQAVLSAQRFLKTEQNGKYTLAFLHFCADYHGHEYQGTLPAIDGTFKLVYRFKWENDGVTDLAYVCDAKGNVRAVEVLYSNGFLSRPFVLADGAIKVLGNLAIEANKKNMSDLQRRLVQELVDDANAKGLLELSLG